MKCADKWNVILFVLLIRFCIQNMPIITNARTPGVGCERMPHDPDDTCQTAEVRLYNSNTLTGPSSSYTIV
jgi:hypothetical protein